MEFYKEKILPCMSSYLDTYVMDIYVDIPPRYKVWVIDINAYLPYYGDPLLFQWDELEQLQQQCTPPASANSSSEDKHKPVIENMKLKVVEREEDVKWDSKLHVQDFEDP